MAAPSVDFERWVDTELLHNIVKKHELDVQNGTDTGPVTTYRGKIKLHGTNGAVNIFQGVVTAQSRNRLISVTDDNQGFANWVASVASAFQSLSFETLPFTVSPSHPVRVFGEWCGKGIFPGATAVSSIPSKIFAVFGILVNETTVIIEPSVIERVLGPACMASSTNIHVIPWQTEAFDMPWSDVEACERIIAEINVFIEEIDKSDPWVKAVFNVPGGGEGIVYYPISLCLETERISINKAVLEHHLFKAKGAGHRVATSTGAAQFKVDKLASQKEFVAKFVTDARCEQGVAEACRGEYKKEHIEAFKAWMVKDVWKESADERELLDSPEDQLKKAVASAAMGWYLPIANMHLKAAFEKSRQEEAGAQEDEAVGGLFD